MHYAEHRMETPDGPKVYLRDYAPQGDARGVPVLCLHGLTRNAADFDGVAPRIASLGRRVVAIDARGRGLSDNDPDPARYRPDVYIGDALRALDAIDIPRAVFLGTSMGGIMTMLCAVMAPQRIAAAILNDIGPEVDPAGVARIASYVGNSGPFESWAALQGEIASVQGPLFPGRGKEFWQTFARRVGRMRDDGRVEFAYDPAIARAFASAPATPPPSMLPLFEALARVPVLVIRGSRSDILSPAGVAAMRRVKPDLDYAEIADTGHAPTLDEPQAWQAIANFLSRAD